MVNTGSMTTELPIQDQAKLSAEVSWYDGINTQTAQVTVSPLTTPEDIVDTVDLSRIVKSDIEQIKCINISSSNDISTLHDMQIVDQNKTCIKDVGQLYDGALYPIGNNWYGVILPNGFDQPILLRIGNTYFDIE